MKTTKLIFLLIVLASCSYLIKDRPISYERIPLKEDGKQRFCQETQKLGIMGSNPYASEVFKETLQKIRTRHALGFIEEAVLWSLFQLNIRPDASSIKSQIQFIYQYENKDFYWSFRTLNESEETGASFLFALHKILKFHKQRNSLVNLAYYLEKNLPSSIPIGDELSAFLNNNKEVLKDHDVFDNVYLRASQVIKAQESIPKLLFSSLVRSHSKQLQDESKYQVTTHLFDSTRFDDLKCSFDINAYDNSIFMIRPHENGHYNSYGLSRGAQNFFMASSSFIPKVSPYRQSFLLEGSSQTYPANLCTLKNESMKLYMLSQKSRDPGQILSQLIQRVRTAPELNLETLDQLNRRGRTMTLLSPERLLIESHRMEEIELDKVFRQKLPFYHISILGQLNLWAEIDKNASFITDPRSYGTPLCQN